MSDLLVRESTAAVRQLALLHSTTSPGIAIPNDSKPHATASDVNVEEKMQINHIILKKITIGVSLV